MKIRIALLAIASTALTGPLYAQPAKSGAANSINYDSTKPIEVNADNFAANLNTDTGTYRGHVVVHQGVVQLSADEVVVDAPQGKATNMDASGHVVVVSPSGNAVGNHGVYDVPNHLIHLTGDVVLTKENNVMRGSALDVDMDTGLAHLVAAPAAPGGRPGRVQGVFVPRQRGDTDEATVGKKAPP